ncbi:MAG: sigma-70 family RNA polymerase sigma factor [Verrucomicrobia bacterium]|nr:sigma-70 family RNA polymerase sigma factor [Verrucomicrobiota bacterium]
MPSDSTDFLPTRWTLLTRLKDWDDQESWRQFFDAYWQLIYNTALKAGLTHTEAEEVVQEVVISVAKKMPEFKTGPAAGSFKAWLLKMTQWRITDQFRKRARDRTAQRAPADDDSRTGTIERIPDPVADQLEAEWDVEWEKNLLHAALQRVKACVKPELFQMFDLLVTKQWPALKVSRRLRVSLAQVYYAKYKVSALVKREIRKIEKRLL